MPDDGDATADSTSSPPPSSPAESSGPQFAGVRLWVWIGATVAALGLCVCIPLYDYWYALRSGAQASAPSPITDSYLPVLPLLMITALAALWNPLVGLCGFARARLRRSELLVSAALLFCTAGIVEGGLRDVWLRSLFVEEGLYRKDEFAKLVPESNNALSVPSETKARDGLVQLERVQSLLAESEPVDAKAWNDIRERWQRLDLSGERRWSPAAQQELLARSDGQPPPGAGALAADIPRLRQIFEGDVRLSSGLRDGDQELAALFSAREGDTAPIARLLPPLATTGIMIISGLLVVIGLAALTAKQWTHNERLQHPLVQVPAALAEPSIIRNKIFWIAVSIIVLIWLYQLGAVNEVHVLPPLNFGLDPLVQQIELYKYFGIDVPSSDRWVYGHWGSLRIYPFIIAIAFLLATDVGFSVWGGFFFGCMFFGYLNSAGLPVSFQGVARANGGGGGAMLAMGLVIFYLGRHHYWSLLRAALFLKRDEPDLLGIFGARLILVGGFVLTAATWYFGGQDTQALFAALLGTLLFMLFIVVTARVVAESGLAAFQAPSHAHELVGGIGIPWMLPVKAVLLLNYLGATLMYDTRQFLPGYLVQSTELAGRGGHGTRRMMILLGSVILVGAGLTVIAAIVGGWSLGGVGDLGDKAAGPFGAKAIKDAFDSTPQAVFLGLTEKQACVFGGFLLVFAVVGLRRVWTGCFIHPLGLVVAASWPIFLAWGSLMLGWLAKLLVLRYGGPSIYSKLKPVAYGIILGDVLGYGLQFVMQTWANGMGEQINILNAWP